MVLFPFVFLHPYTSLSHPQHYLQHTFLSHDPHILVESGGLGTASGWVFWYLLHAPHYVPDISNCHWFHHYHTCWCILDMTSCFRSFRLSSVVVYPLFPTALFPKHVHLRHHCLYYRTCWWISPLTRCRQSFNHQCRKWLRQYMALFIAAWRTDSIGFDVRTHGSDSIRYAVLWHASISLELLNSWPWRSWFDSI